MRNTLLTTTALVLTAGIASADGHATITWSGAATAGIARDGKSAAVKAVAQSASGLVASKAAIADTNDAAGATQSTSVTAVAVITSNVLYVADTIDYVDGLVEAANVATAATHTGTTAATVAADLVVFRAELASDRADLVAAQVGLAIAGADYIALKAKITAIDNATSTLNAVAGSVAVAEGTVGKFKSYSEVNATVTGTVALDNGMSVSASMSVDAGTGYDFADDDTFDSAKGGATLDNVTLNAGALGTFKLDEGAVTHLVDGDDDATADLLYTNTFGSLSFSAAVDLNEDTDVVAKKAAAATVKWVAGVNSSTASLDKDGYTAIDAAAVAAVAEDVQWSAKISMPVAGGSAYVAMDEEGGNIFGASTVLSGVGLSFNSKLEALEERLSVDRSNTLGLTYALGATTLGASWNSVEDGDQWGISAAYAADGVAFTASTDEDSDWAVSGSFKMGTGASVVGGMNYTEDAYLGLSFAF